MKGFNFRVHAPSLVAGGALGLLGGALAGYILAKKAVTTKFDERMDDEIASLKAHYASKQKGSWKDLVASTLQINSPAVDPELEGLDPDEDLDGGEPEDEAPGGELLELPGEYAGPLKRDLTKPYAISDAELAEIPDWYPRETLTWWELDNVLTDEKDEPIQDILRTTGPLTPHGFGGMSKDPHLRYIRNDKLEIFIEVIWRKEAYADVVLGYGNPARVRTSETAGKSSGEADKGSLLRVALPESLRRLGLPVRRKLHHGGLAHGSGHIQRQRSLRRQPGGARCRSEERVCQVRRLARTAGADGSHDSGRYCLRGAYRLG